MFGFRRAKVFSAFVSYSHQDASLAEAIAKRIFDDGLFPWWDRHLLPGQNWSDVIDDILNRCGTTLVLWSEAAVRSDYVRYEASIGRHKKNIVPVSLDGVPPPSLHSDKHYCNLRKEGWDGSSTHPALAVVVDAVSNFQNRKLKTVSRERPKEFDDYNRRIRRDASFVEGKRNRYSGIKGTDSALGAIARDVIAEKRHNETVLAGTVFACLTPLVGVTTLQTFTRQTVNPHSVEPPPPPPLEAVYPFSPDVDSEGSVPNQNANFGAPSDGTPFPDLAENANVDTGDHAPLISAETGEALPLLLASLEESSASTMPPLATVSFYYFRAGSLAPGSGVGALESVAVVPDMLFPIRDAPAVAQTQVYRWGGGIKGGDQCDTRNFLAPWRDNYCETYAADNQTPWCYKSGVHLGQDIRVGTPEGCKAERATKAADRARYEVVAVEDGIISNVGSYSISLRADSGGRIYRYLHLNMAKLKVATNQTVKKGDVLGYVSNDFGGTPTTLHLHFEIKLNTAENGWLYAPPYSSLLAAYKRRENNEGERVADDFIVASTPR